ncbi:MAG: sugar phosphate isomerase/epimerase [bacterium]|nr:sugar phosphate isomerase/epimerase [bacterium]
MYTEPIRIGTLVSGSTHGADYIRQILPHGFESFEVNFWETVGDTDLSKLANEIAEVLEGSDAVVSCVGVYGNPLGTRPQDEVTREGWRALIDAAHLFGCDLVTGFAGRVVDEPIDASMPRFKEVFGELGKRAADKGVRLAFENCNMGGNWKRGEWNIAHDPLAWEMMFDTVPSDNLGLEWEPCHQMVNLIDPMAQLRKWVKKIFHLHGKDATIMWDVIREQGINGPDPFAFHRTPGFGDSNWTDIISELRRGGFVGAIDIEGWHDPVYKDDLEMTGQVHGLNYLKQCRTAYVSNPE